MLDARVFFGDEEWRRMKTDYDELMRFRKTIKGKPDDATRLQLDLNNQWLARCFMQLNYHPDGTKPVNDGNTIFVFGSNRAGIHGAGAAKEALENWGAYWGIGTGRMGQSYGIPTKDEKVESEPLDKIEYFIKEIFLPFAAKKSDLTFFVTRVGCGLAGYSDEQIAPFFKGATMNCNFPEQWKPYLEN